MSEQEEVIFGRHAVASFLEKAAEEGEAAAGARITKILVALGARPDPRLGLIHELARRQRIPVKNCDRRKLDQLLGPQARHQGVAAFLSAAQAWSLQAFLTKTAEERRRRQQAGQSMDGYAVAILDGIEDPHNLGAIVRVAEAAGFKAVIVPQRRAAGLTATVAKVSAGALANLPVVRVSNLVRTINLLKEQGFWVVGLDAQAGQEYTQVDLVRPLAVVIGSEGQGIGRLVRENCDFLVRIPMLGRTESLNASVAAGIVFYEVVRQCRARR